MFKAKYIVTGGQPVKHFPTHRIWLKPLKPIEVRERRIGSYITAEVFKNHLTGKRRDVVFPIFYDYGVDDLTSCVTFLIDEKHWKGVPADKDKEILPGSYHCPELNFIGKISQIVSHIEAKNLYQPLYQTVTKVWNEIEEELKLNRKPRF